MLGILKLFFNLKETIGNQDFGFFRREELFKGGEASIVFVGNVAEGCGFESESIFGGLEGVSDESALLEGSGEPIEQS